jgi:nicotinate-nucleotide adenylyltransferase
MLGGAFDPPHVAHRAMAQHAIVQMQLDVLHVVPTGHAWHKARPLTDATHRLAMCQLAFAGLPQVRLDDREIRRSGPSYTLDTLRELKAQYPHAELVLVMGQDQWDALPSWSHWQTIAELATLVVAARPAESGAWPTATTQTPPTLTTTPPILQHGSVQAQRLAMPLLPISATAIRHTVSQGQGLDPLALVDPAVARYISAHHLYETVT